ncbi:MAG: SDR family NAD(P)-dependent oxidoreductase [Bacillota bacterium]|jgi:NAD(P)-dependent dehydrogenase (short-subunit alcohol dehydrogenase family)
MELKGKRIVITGASSGIGWELLKRLVAAEAQVVGVSRDPQRITDEFGDRGIKAIACDVSDPQQVDDMLAKATKMLGGIDIFVANAGIAYYGKIGEADWEKNEQIFKTNVLSPIYTLQKLTEKDRSEPLIYMITISALGKMVLPGFAFYSATKFALDGFVRTYRMEKPKNVKIIPVYPSAVYTPFFRKAGGKDTPMPLLDRQSPSLTAWCMELGLKMGLTSVYTSIIFIVRCILVRVLPVDLIPQAVEKVRFSAWLKRHGQDK